MPTTSGSAEATSKPSRVCAKTCCGREGAEDLVEEADLDGAGGAWRLGWPQCSIWLRACEGAGELVRGRWRPRRGGRRRGACREGGEFCGVVPVASRCGRAGVVRDWPASRFVAELGGVGEGRRHHDFEVLLVLRGGAGCDFVEPFAAVDLVDAAEAAEGGEELVVAADAGGRDEGAHGEGVDEGVVELLVLEEPLRRGTVPLPQTGCGGMLRVVPWFMPS